jgi:hypothetical protein
VYPFIANASLIDVATSAIIKWYKSLYEFGVGVGGFQMCWMMSQGCVVPAPAIRYLPRLVIFVIAWCEYVLPLSSVTRESAISKQWSGFCIPSIVVTLFSP